MYTLLCIISKQTILRTSPYIIPTSHLFSLPGGWNPETGTDYPSDLSGEIDQAFRNVDLAVRTAGGKGGWSQVFRLTSYHVVLDDDVFQAMVRNLKQWVPDHRPIWTCVAVPKLSYPEMRVEIEVVALDE